MQEKKSLSVLSLFFSVPDCLHAVSQIVTLPEVSAVQLWKTAAQFKQVSPPKSWVGDQDMSVFFLPGKEGGLRIV